MERVAWKLIYCHVILRWTTLGRF